MGSNYAAIRCAILTRYAIEWDEGGGERVVGGAWVVCVSLVGRVVIVVVVEGERGRS